MKKWHLFLLIAFCISSIGMASEWVSTELCVIGWGEGPDQLFMLPEETTDSGFLAPATGPDKAFIDQSENIIISSFQAYQLKGFKNTGELLFDFSTSGPGAKSEILRYSPENIYVDSLSYLYIQSNPGTEYVPVVDYDGNIIKKIRPFAGAPSAQIQLMNWNPAGTLFFFNRRYGWVTYIDGVSNAGGSGGFKANNGSFYSVIKKSATSLGFNRYEKPDITGLARTRELTEVPIEVDTLIGAELLNGGDGNIYQFLCEDDGMHIFRWSKAGR